MSGKQKEDAKMIQPPRDDAMTVALLHELDVGEHTLLIMDDGSIEVLVQDEQGSYNGIRLESDETYRLFLSLQEQFRGEQQARAQRGDMC